MKIFIALTTLILGIVSPSLSQTVPKENQVILSDAKDWPEIKWTPTEKQTAKALTAIEHFLNDPKALKPFGDWTTKEIAKIKEHFTEYRVQLGGVVKDNKEYIFCNFFKPSGLTEFQNWKQQPVIVDDGGFWYWSILYNPETGELSSLEINGEA